MFFFFFILVESLMGGFLHAWFRYRRHVDLNNLDWDCKSKSVSSKGMRQTLLQVAEKGGLTVERRGGLTGQVMVFQEYLDSNQFISIRSIQFEPSLAYYQSM